MKHEGSLAEALGISPDEEAVTRLEVFERMLSDRAVPMGMVSSSDIPRLRVRHVLDCLRAAPLLPASGLTCDLGSGAGLPGIVLAIARPDLRIVLIEARLRRAAFLEECVRRLGLAQVSVYAGRAENFRDQVDACVARAFGSPARSWEAAQRVLAPSGILIYWAGESFDRARDVPEGVAVRHFSTPALAGSGTLVIMARQ